MQRSAPRRVKAGVERRDYRTSTPSSARSSVAQRDVANIVELLQARRLVSIVGPGGVGKTRIAIEIALHPDTHWRDGTWLVELGARNWRASRYAKPFNARSAPRLGHAVGEDTMDWLTTGLATAELLIVLDNCEHVLAEAAAVASAIVRRARASPSWPQAVSRSASRVNVCDVLEPLELDDADSAVRQPSGGFGRRVRTGRCVNAGCGQDLRQCRSAAVGDRADSGSHASVFGASARRAS